MSSFDCAFFDFKTGKNYSFVFKMMAQFFIAMKPNGVDFLVIYKHCMTYR